MKKRILSGLLSLCLILLSAVAVLPTQISALPGNHAETRVETLLVSVDMGYEYQNGSNESHGINGMCYIIRLLDGTFVIVDGGWDDNIICNRIYNTLKAYAPEPERIVVSGWIITHPHMDHYGAIRYIANNQSTYKDLSVEKVIYAFPPAAYLEQNNLTDKVTAFYNAVSKLKQSNGQPTATVIASKTVDGKYETIDINGAKMDPYYAAGEDFDQTAPVNASSLVFRLRTGGNSFLFTGDMTGEIAELIKSTVPAVDFYQIPHHGCEDETGKGDQLKEFYLATKARYVLFPASEALYQQNRGLSQNAYLFEGDTKPTELYVSNKTQVIYPQRLMKKEYGGEGTPESPYLIKTYGNLLHLNSQFKADATSFTGAYFRLENDIDCGGASLRLGTSGKKFGGVFDGNGHTISNFKNDVTVAPNGMFAYIDGGTVKNLTVDNAYLKTTNTKKSTSFSGVIAGYAGANSQILGCTVLNSEVVGVIHTGGIVGKSNLSTISDCVVSDTRIANLDDETIQGECEVDNTYAIFTAGGIVGWSQDSNIKSCINYGTVALNVKKINSGAKYSLLSAGGIVGQIYQAKTAASGVTECINHGSVFGTTSLEQRMTVGGIVGRFRTGASGKIESSYNLSTAITASSQHIGNAGQLVGFINNNTTATVKNCMSVAHPDIVAGGDGAIAIDYDKSATLVAENNKIATAEEIAVPVAGIQAKIKANRVARLALIGLQTTEAVGGVYSVRILLGLDHLDYAYYKIVTTATYERDGVTQTANNGGKPLTVAYDTVYAAGEPVSAVRFGSDYLGAIVLSEVPADTAIAFVIRAYVGDAAGNETLVDSVTCQIGNQ